MKEKILIYYDNKKRKAVFLCPYEYCDFGVIHTGHYETMDTSLPMAEIIKEGNWFNEDKNCPKCNGSGIKVFDIPKI